MVLDFFRGTSASAVEDVEATIVQMLRDGATVYDAATQAVFGGGKSKETKQEVRSTDRDINQGQQEVRRALLLHAAVTGGVELPLMLAYMSVVKDVERIGDYAKNVYDLAKYGIDFNDSADRETLKRYCDNVARLIDEAVVVFESRDSDRAQALVQKADGFLDEYDDNIKEQFNSTAAPSEAVARALYYRYLKRITAHVMNLMTSMVMPIDRLDYYDEAKEDRS